MGSIAFACDFDSTLYFRDREDAISGEDIAAIQRFREKGGLFGVCTGRPYFGVLDALEERLSFDFFICTSGARILGPEGQSMLERRLSRDLLDELWDLGKRLPFMVIHANDRLYSPVPVNRKFQVQIQSPADIPGSAFHGVSFYAQSEEEAADLAAYAHRRWPDRISAYHNSFCMDAVPAGVSKGGALSELKKMLGCSAVAAMGDSFNDMSMLEAADISFTFPDSPAAVRSAAGHIASSVADAIAFLERTGMQYPCSSTENGKQKP